MTKSINDLLNLNLQFFAEGDDNPPGDSGEDKTDDKPDKVELTDEELQKKIEAESDRKLAKALEKKQKEWESQTQQKIQDAIAEKERLAKLSEKERKEEEMTQREKELNDRLAELERKELKADAVADLNGKELPSDFADFLLAENAENTLNNINNFKKAFDDAVNAKVKEALRQDTPKGSTGSTGVTKDQFQKMGYEDRVKLFNDNPELYKQLNN